MDLTPEQIEATGKALVSVIGAFGAIVATVASTVIGFYTYRNRRDLHIAHDRIRGLSGEPLQYRHDPERRHVMRQALPLADHPEDTNAGGK